jgi:hypothetical protein
VAWGARARHLWRRFLDRRKVEQELDDEVQSYFEILMERGMARGLTREEALREARVRFEGAEQIKQRVREERVGAPIDTTLQDIRYAWRSLTRSPGSLSSPCRPSPWGWARMRPFSAWWMARC